MNRLTENPLPTCEGKCSLNRRNPRAENMGKGARDEDCESTKDGFICTLPKSHQGPHIACSTRAHNLKVWTNWGNHGGDQP